MNESKTDKFKTIIYEIPTLDCPACALKLENLIKKQDHVIDASISYPTKTLRLTAEDPDSLIPSLIKRCNEVESPTEIYPRGNAPHKKHIHNHAHEHTHDHNHNHDHKFSDFIELIHWNEKKQLVIGGIIFIIGMILHYFPFFNKVIPSYFSDIFFFISYLILGLPIVCKALKNIIHGEFFDETFLMTIATLGAFGIHEYPEATGVMFFYCIGEYLQDLATGKSRKQIMEAMDLRPEVIYRVNGKEIDTIPAEEAKIGDIILIRPGDRIPLDGILIEGTSLIDTSAITGESRPISANEGMSVDSGCVNMTGTIKMKVSRILSESMVTRILSSVEDAVTTKPKMDRFITRFSRVYTPLVVFTAILVAVVPPLFFGAEWDKWIYVMLTFLVISCPCALVISVPLAFFSGIGAASKSGIILKSGNVMETLSKIKTVIMDKTGTITEGKFKVNRIVSISNMKKEEILAIAAGAEKHSTHPIAASILEAVQHESLSVAELQNLHEIAGYGITGILDGKPVYVGNMKLMKENEIHMENISLPADQSTHVYVALDTILLGYIEVVDSLKIDTISSIKQLKSMGIHPVILTGDNKSNAESVAQKAGISTVYSDLLPEDKLSIMKVLRKKENPLMFIGDGINDAPVIAGSDVGAAMGSGSDAALEAADIVFLNSTVRSIPDIIQFSKKVISTAWINVGFALLVKIAVMIMGLLGYANMWIAVFADTGVTLLCILYSARLLNMKI